MLLLLIHLTLRSYIPYVVVHIHLEYSVHVSHDVISTVDEYMITNS